MTQAQQKFYSVAEWSEQGGKLDTTGWSQQAKTYYLCANYNRSAMYLSLVKFDRALANSNPDSQTLIDLKSQGRSFLRTYQDYKGKLVEELQKTGQTARKK